MRSAGGFSCRQYHDEHVNDYIRQFKQLRDTLEELIGMRLLDYYYDNNDEYKTAPTKKTLAKKNGWDLLMATILVDGSDKDKFGSLKKDLQSQFNRGNDQYPKTVEAAQEILSEHRIDDAYFERRKRQNQRSDTKPNASKPSVATVETSFAQKEIICYCCGKKGHASPDCMQ